MNYTDTAPGIRGHFGVADYIILVVALTASLVVGVMSGWRRNRDTRDFLTGDRNMNPFAVCFSLLGGFISAISVQGNATEIYLHGTQLWMNLLGCLWGTFVVMFLLLPVTYPLNVVSLCQYLEMRFASPSLKRLASLLQIVNLVLYLGVCLYAPSLTLSAALGIPTSFALVILGVICGIYTSLGGVRAVLYTDVIQTTMMFVGVIAVVTQVLVDLGGFSVVWNIAEKGERLEFFNLDVNPMVRHSFWSVQVLGLNVIVSLAGISQVQFQRLSSVRSLRISQGLCVAFFVGLSVLWSTFYFSGLVAYAAYSDCDPVKSGKIEKADQIMAFMVGDKLSYITGLVGLFVAAVAGAVLSSLSSHANAIVVLIWEDFLNNWWIFAKMTQKMATKTTMVLSAGITLLTIVSAVIVSKLGTLFQAAYSISGALVGPFDGLFITGITAPWVTGKGAISGFVVSLVLNVWLVMGKFYYGAGKSEPLPLSTTGCPLEGHMDEMPFNTTDSVSQLFSASLQEEETHDYWRIYDVSYCYLGTIGILTVYIVSSIVSLATGAVKPKDVDRRLVSKTCFAVYCWLLGHKASLPSEVVGMRETASEALMDAQGTRTTMRESPGDDLRSSASSKTEEYNQGVVANTHSPEHC